jgi:hypothetical protein
MHALVKSLGIEKLRGRARYRIDGGLRVRRAVSRRSEKPVVMTLSFPASMDGRASIIIRQWHFRFNGPIPEALVEGRERTYFEHY